VIDPASWRPADGLVLEHNADIAVRETARHVALTAGPGTGKTELLAQRADFLLRTGACRYPRRILAISFKVDAARNLEERVRRRGGHRLASRLDSRTFHAFAKGLIDRYRPVLTGADALDADYTLDADYYIPHKQITFREMVPLALDIVQGSATARSAIQQTYSHVFLDEFQDCTGPQYQLVRSIFLGTGALLTAVGDTKQKLMGWAGALDGIFATMAEDFDARPLNLYINRRSLPRLRRMQNAMVQVMDPAAAAPAEHLEGDGGTVSIFGFDGDQQEAEHVAQLVADAVESGTPYAEIAVLVSKQPALYAAKLMARLTELGIPHRNDQAVQDLTAERVGEVVLDLLRVVFTDRQPDAYYRLMRFAGRGTADDETLSVAHARWCRYIQDGRGRVAAGTLDGADPEQIRGLVDGFLDLVSREALAALSFDYQRGGRLEQLVEMVLNAFAEQLAVDLDPRAALRRISEDSAVRVLTIHKSKSLEFDTVVILGVEEEAFWGNIEDERAAFFVGISRAKSLLVLTTAQKRPRPAGHHRLWHVDRTPQQEFLNYATETD